MIVNKYKRKIRKNINAPKTDKIMRFICGFKAVSRS